jgi:hypothetical protein
MAFSRWYHGLNMLLGTGLLLYPSLLELDGAAQAITYGAGAIIALTAAWALVRPRARHPMWITLFASAGYFFAPGFVGGGTGFPPRAAAAVWLTSLLVLACVRIGLQRARPTSPTLSRSQTERDQPVAPAHRSPPNEPARSATLS